MIAEELRIGNYHGYAVREDGVIYGKKSGKPLNFRINDKGYPTVSIMIGKTKVCKRVHRIVAQTFIPNPDNKPCVNHLDRDRSNPSLSNLEWCTHSENVKHSVINGGRKNWTRANVFGGDKSPNAKLTWKIVNAIRDLHASGKYSQNDLSEIFKLNQGKINKLINHKEWKVTN